MYQFLRRALILRMHPTSVYHSNFARNLHQLTKRKAYISLTPILIKAQQVFQDILRFIRDPDLDYLGFANASEEVTVEILNGIGYSGNKFKRTNLRLALDHAL